ncbi:MAG TPA: SCP2 sterol-binding domain-containing protein [Acidimicrobiia bacterium]|nr:SCP2 sterol-binding domain-containing protein [Acidimicrobiia bacterium]
MSRPTFGTRELYDALAEALNEDPKWLEKAKVLNYTMTHVYTAPISKAFGFRFEGGKLLDVTESDGTIPADFVLTATPEIWQRMLVDQSITPQVAMVTRKVSVDGKLSVLLKHISVFNYLLAVLIGLEPKMDPNEE